MGRPRPLGPGSGQRALTPDRAGDRTCVVCRARTSSSHLLRFRLVEAGRAGADFSADRPGRGAWCCSKARCLGTIKPGNVARSLKAEVRRLEDPRPDLRAVLLQRLRLATRLAWRSGLLLERNQVGSAGPPFVASCRWTAEAPPSADSAVGLIEGDLPILIFPFSRAEMQDLLGRALSGPLVIREGRPTRTLRAELRRLHDLG